MDIPSRVRQYENVNVIPEATPEAWHGRIAAMRSGDHQGVHSQIDDSSAMAV
jgi:hypothetical protein